MIAVKIFEKFRDTVVSSPVANSEVFAGLYRRYCDSMLNICIRMTGDRAKAEDILHDSFIIAFEQFKKLRNDERFGGWLRKIVISQCLKDLKKNKVWLELNENVVIYEEKEDEKPWWNSIEIEQINVEIGRLPNGCRQVFILYAMEDYSHKDIGEHLDITDSTSKTQYRRAKQLLKQQLEKLNTNG